MGGSSSKKSYEVDGAAEKNGNGKLKKETKKEISKKTR
mgnify:CR=1 FL=1